MTRDFEQSQWNAAIERDLLRLLEIACEEDTQNFADLTSQALIPPGMVGNAEVRARQNGILAGVKAVSLILKTVDENLQWEKKLDDGAALTKGSHVGTLSGPVLSLLTAERLVLNLLGKLSGIATTTSHYVATIQGTGAKIYDTRKTTLGWRKLEKYAVRCGGGYNHRMGLFDAILIKDNHLAFGAVGGGKFRPADAVVKAKKAASSFSDRGLPPPIIEIEVDTLEQLAEVLPVKPDMVLLDNMPPEMLREAVNLRNKWAGNVELEASGGINLETVRAVATTGVERISVGALTHSAITLDLGLDWQ